MNTEKLNFIGSSTLLAPNVFAGPVKGSRFPAAADDLLGDCADGNAVLDIPLEPSRRAPAANDTALGHDADEQDEDSEHEAPDAAPSARGNAKLKLRRIVGPRLQRARELSGLGQTEAAKLLGYATPAQLCLWEMCRRSAPITELIKAAAIYGVSLDFLVGESNEVDRDPSMALRHACLKGVRQQLERVSEITVAAIERQVRLVGPHAGNVRSLLSSGDSLLDAVAGFIRFNSEAFSEQRGGGTLQRCADEFGQELHSARTAIRLHDAQDLELRRSLAAIDDADPSPAGS